MSGLCLDVSGGASTAGTTIHQGTCDEQAPQNWTLTAASDGSFALQAQNGGSAWRCAAQPRRPARASSSSRTPAAA